MNSKGLAVLPVVMPFTDGHLGPRPPQTWHLDAIHCHVGHVQQAAERALHFGGGHILAFPAERVPRAVSEVQVAQLVHHQHVA